jgi:hypothetical protein
MKQNKTYLGNSVLDNFHITTTKLKLLVSVLLLMIQNAVSDILMQCDDKKNI